MLHFRNYLVHRTHRRLSAVLVGAVVLGALSWGVVAATGALTTPATFSLAASPNTQAVSAGASTSFAVTMTPGRSFSGTVSLSVSGLPAGATASFSRTGLTSSSNTSSLLVTTSSTTPNGPNTLTITGTNAGQTVTTTSKLTVNNGRVQTGFTIAGGPSQPVYPGAAAVPVNVTITNPNSYDLSITNMTASLVSVVPQPGKSCDSSAFRVQQFTGAYPFTVRAGQTVSLSSLGFSSSQLPQISMVDNGASQDGCQKARLNLSYTGTASH